jgi:hypothetical protein
MKERQKEKIGERVVIGFLVLVLAVAYAEVVHLILFKINQ